MAGICHAYELIKYIYVLRKLRYLWGNISFTISFQIKFFTWVTIQHPQKSIATDDLWSHIHVAWKVFCQNKAINEIYRRVICRNIRQHVSWVHFQKQLSFLNKLLLIKGKYQGKRKYYGEKSLVWHLSTHLKPAFAFFKKKKKR